MFQNCVKPSGHVCPAINVTCFYVYLKHRECMYIVHIYIFNYKSLTYLRKFNEIKCINNVKWQFIVCEDL